MEQASVNTCLESWPFKCVVGVNCVLLSSVCYFNLNPFPLYIQDNRRPYILGVKTQQVSEQVHNTLSNRK